MIFHFTLLCLAVTGFVHSNALENAPGERELRKVLFQDYDKNSRPVKKYATAVPVNITLSPLRLNFLDEEKHLMNLDSWLLFTWTDEYLTWNPVDYDNVTDLRVPPTEVWTPDISLYNASPDTAFFPKRHADILVFSNGILMWVPPFTVSSKCQVPSRPVYYDNKFPKALIAQCNIRMGSWTYSEKMLNLQLGEKKVDLSDFEDDNLRWKLLKVDSNRVAKIYPCCPEAYPYIDFNMTFVRQKGIRGNSVPTSFQDSEEF